MLPDGATVICNDEFGALTTALHLQEPWVWNDSALAHQAIANNYERNSLTSSWSALPSIDDMPSGTPIGLVLIKIPKNLSLLEDQLARLAKVVSGSTIVIGAAKAKHIHTSTLTFFERYLGETTTSLAKQKARLIFCTPTKKIGLSSVESPWPKTFAYDGRPVSNHANVFSHRKLDQGTRFLLEQMQRNNWASEAATAIDLGCGNALLGLQAISQNSALACTFVDRSYMALDSARRNVVQWFGRQEPHQFLLGDALRSVDGKQRLVQDGSVDLVLCNPPFHDNHVMGEESARKMFTQAAGALAPGGRLVVVANRHLHYHSVLKKLFTSYELAASNKKFVVHSCQKV